MILYVTDKDGKQYKAEIESQVNSALDYTFGSPVVNIEKWVEYDVKVTQEVDEFKYTANAKEDPAVVLERLFELIQGRLP